MRRTAIVSALLGAGLLAACAPGNSQDRPTGVRTLILVRHGVYDDDDPRDPAIGKGLIPRGEEQARLTGARLRRLVPRPDVLYMSPFTRARQTAAIIGDSLGMTPVLVSDLQECTPPTVREDIMARETAGGPDSCRRQLERAWSRFFRPSPLRDSTEVLVCHGNVIRFLVGKALGLHPTLWLNMSVANCSVTVIQFAADGRARVLTVGDVGHLPPAQQGYPPAPRTPDRR